jgi:hypothetical protein
MNDVELQGPASFTTFSTDSDSDSAAHGSGSAHSWHQHRHKMISPAAGAYTRSLLSST